MPSLPVLTLLVILRKCIGRVMPSEIEKSTAPRAVARFDWEQRERSLAALHPEAAAQLHPTRNGEVDAWMLGPCSQLRVWWLCVNGHEWQQLPQARIKALRRGIKCPQCWSFRGPRISPERSLVAVHPQLVAELDYERNGELNPWRVGAGSGRKLWWRCSKGHVWSESVIHRARGCGCPYCSGRRSPLDHGAFRRPDAQGWYWLGFLGADGCVGDDASIYLRLGARDLDHIKAFRTFVGGGERRIYGPHKGCYCLTIRSRAIAADLARWAGIEPRKSLTYDCGARAAREWAFWLGLLDGDGIVYWHRDRRGGANYATPELRWNGARSTIERCADFLRTEMGMDQRIRSVPTRSGGLFGITVSGDAARRMAAGLLRSCTYSLPRKRATLETFVA
jgi:Probable Zinc-ribbon domain